MHAPAPLKAAPAEPCSNESRWDTPPVGLGRVCVSFPRTVSAPPKGRHHEKATASGSSHENSTGAREYREAGGWHVPGGPFMVDLHATIHRGPDMPDWGGSREAARVLEMPESTFNRVRLRATYVYDPVTRSLSPLDPDATGLRAQLGGLHLTAPTLAGQKLPGHRWEFRLDLLKRYRTFGWPAAEFPVLAPEESGEIAIP